MKRLKVYLFYFSVLLLTSSFVSDTSTAMVRTALADMFTNTDQVESMTFVMKKKERVNDVYLDGEVEVKFNKEPYKVYIKQVNPNPGMEILFVKHENHNRALINPNGFPWVSVSLDPMGDRMRRNQHHTVLETGFDYVMSILRFEMESQGESVFKKLSLDDDVMLRGKACKKITYKNTDYQIVDHKVKEGETLWRVARNRRVSEFMLRELNPSIGTFYEKIDLETIKVPSGYAKKLEIYLDKDLGVPLSILVHDHKGLFERYDYHDLKINPEIADEEFTSGYKDYRFR